MIGPRTATNEGVSRSVEDLVDVWALGEATHLVIPSDSFLGSLAAARTSRRPYVVTGNAKNVFDEASHTVVQPLGSQPCSLAVKHVKKAKCFVPKMLLPESLN